MKIVVLTLEEDDVLLRLAHEIAEGIGEAGETPAAAKNLLDGRIESAELVFFGFTAHRRLFWNYVEECSLRALKANPELWRGKKLAFFSACYGEASRAAMADAVREAGARGARVANTIALVAEKTRQGGWEAGEVDLARARGFGERTTNNAKGASVFRPSEKRRIKKYLK